MSTNQQHTLSLWQDSLAKLCSAILKDDSNSSAVGVTTEISTHGEAKRSLEVLGGDKDRQLHTLWKETKIGEILPWDDIEEEVENLLQAGERRGELQTVTRLTNNEMTNQ